jgi:hypothetical protein
MAAELYPEGVNGLKRTPECADIRTVEPLEPLGGDRPMNFVASADVHASGFPAAPPLLREDPIKPVPTAGPTLRARFDALVAEAKAAPVRWRRIALLLIVTVAGLSLLGAFYRSTGSLHWFNVSGEVREGGFFVPVLFSWAVLCGAGVAYGLRSRWAETSAEHHAWLALGLFLAFMAFDELLMIHETVETRLGIDWQLVYLPVVAVGGIAYLWLLREMPRWSLQQVMFIAAAGLWCFSQVLEKLEYTNGDTPVANFWVYDGIEKVAQFTGSTLFLLVGLLALERIFSRFDDAAAAR